MVLLRKEEGVRTISRGAARQLLLFLGVPELNDMPLLRRPTAALPICDASIDACGHHHGVFLGASLFGGREHGLEDTSYHLLGTHLRFLHPHARLLRIHVLKAPTSSALRSLRMCIVAPLATRPCLACGEGVCAPPGTHGSPRTPATS